MARRSFLALLRGADGRSIGRALAFLVLVNALLAGLHTGALAASGDRPGVICSLVQPVGGSGGTPATPDRESPCCFAGCVMAAAILPPAAAIAPSTAIDIGRAVGAAWAEPAGLRFHAHGARGPPSLA